jgi:hypothetical protein
LVLLKDIREIGNSFRILMVNLENTDIWRPKGDVGRINVAML